MLLSDHLFFPEKLRSRYPYSPDGKPGFDGETPFPEVWTSIAAMAAATTRLHFSTIIFVLPLRNPLEVAKTLGTLSLLSGGRVALGCGAGWIREEFDQLGVEFSTRGKRFDEMIDVMRALWRGGMVEHHGRFFDFDRLQMSPAPRAAGADLRRRPLPRRRCAVRPGSATAGSEPARTPPSCPRCCASCASCAPRPGAPASRSRRSAPSPLRPTSSCCAASRAKA